MNIAESVLDKFDQKRSSSNTNFLKSFTEFKSYPKWDDFIKGNKKHIDKKVSDIKKSVSIISDKKNQEKKFKEEMRSFKNDLLKVWDLTKGDK